MTSTHPITREHALLSGPELISHVVSEHELLSASILSLIKLDELAVQHRRMHMHPVGAPPAVWLG